MQSRRRFFRQVTGAAALTALDPLLANGSAIISLGYGTHGFKSYPAGKAIKSIAGIGYDSVEMCLVPGWTDPPQCSSQERRELRSTIGRHRLAVPCLFDRVEILGDAGQHKAHLERLRVDAQFGHDVNAGVGGVTPCIGTRLGGNTKDFEANKNLLADRVHDWAALGREMQTIIAIKGHPPMIVDTSERTQWLIGNVNSPWIRVEFDYSHFQMGGEQLAATLDRLLPYTVVIALQDNKKNNSKSGWEHTLPGDGDTDHEEYYRRLVKFDYKGHTVVWVNDGLFDSPGFDAAVAAKHCYAKLAPAMAKAGVQRPRYREGT